MIEMTIVLLLLYPITTLALAYTIMVSYTNHKELKRLQKEIKKLEELV